MKIRHVFVDNIPDKLEDGILYVSIKYATAIHQCCCGCGNQVVTPISPIDWKLSFDGETVSLYPSIGNWSFPCQSHYWIRDNEVIWSRKWSLCEITTARAKETRRRDLYYKRYAKQTGTDENKKQ